MMAKWFKGNIHTHTTESDGDETPEKVVRWFRRHGYDFLVLSDHNHVTLLNYGAGKRRFKRPLMIPGEEVSARIKGGAIPIHINGIGISRVIGVRLSQRYRQMLTQSSKPAASHL